MNISGKVLFVASTGGHLTQLERMARSWEVSKDSVWVTFDTEQSRSLLADRRVLYVPYVPPRGIFGVIKARNAINELLRNEKFDMAISTGAGLALAAFTSRRLLFTKKKYIESVSRTTGPSVTGRIISALKLAKLHTQHPKWADHRWTLVPSVLDEYKTVIKHKIPPRPSLFITLGTIKPYRFDSMVDTILRTGLADETTVWQVGETSRDDLPGRVYSQMEASEFSQCIQDADVTVTHAGVGTILQLLEAGECPVVLPREARRSEHVDDHQGLICDYLEEKNLGVVRTTGLLTKEDLVLAASRRTIPAQAQI